MGRPDRRCRPAAQCRTVGEGGAGSRLPSPRARAAPGRRGRSGCACRRAPLSAVARTARPAWRPRTGRPPRRRGPPARGAAPACRAICGSRPARGAGPAAPRAGSSVHPQAADEGGRDRALLCGHACLRFRPRAAPAAPPRDACGSGLARVRAPGPGGACARLPRPAPPGSARPRRGRFWHTGQGLRASRQAPVLQAGAGHPSPGRRRPSPLAPPVDSRQPQSAALVSVATRRGPMAAFCH